MKLLIGLDTETHLITPGNLAPKVVCLTAAGGGAYPTGLPATGSDCVGAML